MTDAGPTSSRIWRVCYNKRNIRTGGCAGAGGIMMQAIRTRVCGIQQKEHHGVKAGVV
jgi:hypothetical protein